MKHKKKETAQTIELRWLNSVNLSLHDTTLHGQDASSKSYTALVMKFWNINLIPSTSRPQFIKYLSTFDISLGNRRSPYTEEVIEAFEEFMKAKYEQFVFNRINNNKRITNRILY